MEFGGGACRRFAGFALLISAFLVVAAASAAAPSARTVNALDGEETAVLTIINNYRAQNGLGPLSLDPQLNDSARWMANDMAAGNYFSHTDSLGRDPFTRMDAFGYNYNTWRGENLAAGSESAAQAFDLWSGSPGHNANMLGANYTVIGIARSYSASSTFGWYWATDFGGQGAAPPPPPAPAAVELTPEPYVPPAEPVEQSVVAPGPTEESLPPPAAPTVPPTAAPTETPAPPAQDPPWWRSLSAVTDQWEGSSRSESDRLNVDPAFSGFLG